MLSIVYCASTIICIASILTSTRTYTKLLWLPIAIVLQVSFLALTFGILAFAQIGYSTALATGVNLAFSVALILYNHYTTDKVASDEGSAPPKANRIRSILASLASLNDLVCYLAIVAVAVIWVYLQFGPSMDLSFWSSDAANHCKSIYQIYSENPVTGQYFSYLFTVSLMSMWPAQIPQELCYIPFMYGEILSFILSGLAFYACLRAWCAKMGILTQAVIVVLYMMGYPLTGLLNGYSYLCMSITVIASLLFVCQTTSTRSVSLLSKCALSLLLLDLATSYLLFVPPIFLGVMIFLVALLRKQEQVRVSRLILTLSLMFIVPVVIGFGITYLGFGFGIEAKPASAVIKVEAGAFKILYSPFVFIAPLFIYGFISRMKDRRFSSLEYMTTVFVLYTMLLLALGMLQRVSAYYYFKQYYVLWLLFFLYVAIAVQLLKQQQPIMLCSYCITWITIIILLFTGIDKTISEKRPRFNLTPASYEFLPVYADNVLRVGTERYDDDALALIERADELREAGNEVNLLMNDNLMRWDTTLYGHQNLVWWGYTDEELLEELRSFDYIALNDMNPHLVNADGHTFAETVANSDLLGKEVYSNDRGAIYEVQR